MATFTRSAIVPANMEIAALIFSRLPGKIGTDTRDKVRTAHDDTLAAFVKNDPLGRAMRAEEAIGGHFGTYLLRGPERG
jgi:hypothetical protein